MADRHSELLTSGTAPRADPAATVFGVVATTLNFLVAERSSLDKFELHDKDLERMDVSCVSLATGFGSFNRGET